MKSLFNSAVTLLFVLLCRLIVSACGVQADVEIVSGPFVQEYCTSFRITFATDIPSSGFVRYSINEPPEPPGDFDYEAHDFFFRNAHTVYVHHVPAGGVIYFQACASAEGTEDCEPETGYLTAETLPSCDDVDGPEFVQAPVQAAASADSVFLEWVTDEKSRALLLYGESPDELEHAVSLVELKRNHLEKIQPESAGDSWYYYSIIAYDASYNFSEWTAAESSYFHLSAAGDDEPPAIAGPVHFDWLDEFTVHICFYTDEYGLNRHMWDIAPNCYQYQAYEMQHPFDEQRIYLENLLPDYPYMITVQLEDLYENESIWTDCIAIPPPEPDAFLYDYGRGEPVLLNGPEAVYVSDCRAVISWETRFRGYGTVEYWITGDPETTRQADHSPIGADGKMSLHYVSLPHLEPATDYSYTVMTDDYVHHGIFSFTTNETPDQSEPVITEGPHAYSAGTNALIVWETEDFSDSQVQFGADMPLDRYKSRIARGNAHTVILSGLTPGLEYFYRIASRDPAFNSFISSAASFTASEDSSAPSLAGAPILLENDLGFYELNFQTDEPCFVSVEHGPDPSYGYRTQREGYRLKHAVGLPGSVSGSDWYVRIRLQDFSKNTSDHEHCFESSSPTPVPTFTPTSPPSPSHTVIASPSPSPTAFPSSSPTSPPSLIPTPTPSHGPSPLEPVPRIELLISKNEFHPSDRFLLYIKITYTGRAPISSIPFVLMLDVYGCTFWHPGWTEEFDYQLLTVEPGTIERNIFDFIWPDERSCCDSASFYGALLNEELDALFGRWDDVRFGWDYP